MEKDSIIYIEHIQNCIHKISEYTNGLNEAGFLQNSMVQDAVIRNLEIIDRPMA